MLNFTSKQHDFPWFLYAAHVKPATPRQIPLEPDRILLAVQATCIVHSTLTMFRDGPQAIRGPCGLHAGSDGCRFVWDP